MPYRRPLCCGNPSDQQLCSDIIRKVGDNAGLLQTCAKRSHVNGHGVIGKDFQPAGIMRGNFLQRGNATVVTFNRRDAASAIKQQRPRQATGAWTDFDDIRAFERTGRAGDFGRQVEVEQEILAKRLLWRQPKLVDHIAQWRQAVDACHANCARVTSAIRAAMRRAAIKLLGFALPLPAIPNAVP